MTYLNRIYKISLWAFASLFVTFTLGLIRALLDINTTGVQMTQTVLYLHISFASLTDAFSWILFILARKTGLIFPKVLASLNVAAVSSAGFSGIMFLLTHIHAFVLSMLYSFEISFGLSSMLIGYLYCFYRNCLR